MDGVQLFITSYKNNYPDQLVIFLYQATFSHYKSLGLIKYYSEEIYYYTYKVNDYKKTFFETFHLWGYNKHSWNKSIQLINDAIKIETKISGVLEPYNLKITNTKTGISQELGYNKQTDNWQ